MATWMKNLIERRVPHSVALYLGVSWGFVQFAHFTVAEFLLSPHWTRVVLATVLLFLPSVVMLGWYHGLPGRNRVTLTEKIGIPTNLALAALVLVLMFNGTDLGAAVTRVTVEDEDGETVERAIPKTEFRKRTAVFVFDGGPGLGADDAWMSYVAPEALEMDLMSDDFFEPISGSALQERLQEAGFKDLRNVPFALKRELSEANHAEFIVSGMVDRAADRHQMTMAVHQVDTGALVDERRYDGPDFLGLIDQMSVDLKTALEIPARDGIEDLRVRERLTADAEALEAFGRARQAQDVDSDFGTALKYLSSATDIDPTFAQAHFGLAATLINTNRPEEAAAAMQACLDHIYKLPERMQFRLKFLYYLFVANEPARARALSEMWVDLYPEDPQALENLLQMEALAGNSEGMLAILDKLYALDPGNADLLKQIAAVHEQSGNENEALAALQQYAERFPDDYTSYTAQADLQRRLGNHDRARDNLDRALLLEPGFPQIVRVMASLDLDVGRFADALAGYQRALALARSPRERAAAQEGLRDYYSFRGEMENALAATRAWVDEATEFMPPWNVAQNRIQQGDTYFDAGRGDEFIMLLQELRPQLESTSITRFMVDYAELRVAIALEDVVAARAAHDRALQAMERAQLEVMRPNLIADQGRLDELAGDYASALGNYRRAMEFGPAYDYDRLVGRALGRLGRLDEAESALQEALRLTPADPRAHLETAYVLEAKDDRPGAIEHLRSALRAWEHADEVYQPARDAREKLPELGG